MHKSVLIYYLCCGFGIFVIPFHHVVTAAAYFALYIFRTLQTGFRIKYHYFGKFIFTSHRTTSHFKRIVHAGLSHAGRCFGHAIHTGNVHKHFFIYLPHQFYGTKCSCHNPRTERTHIEKTEHWMIKLCNKHGGHTVKHRAAFLVDGSEGNERIKPLHHHLRTAMRKAAHGGQHHTKAVKQRYTDTAFIFRGKFHVYTGEVSVVGDVVMGEHHPFGKTGGSGGVLHIHHIVATGEVAKPGQFIIFHIIAQQEYFGRIVHAAVFFLTDVHHVFQFRKPFTFEFTALRGFQFGHQLIDNVGIVISGHSVSHTQGVHIRVFEQVRNFFRLVVGIDGNCHRTNFGRCVEKCKPVGYVLRPDTHVGSTAYTYGYQSFCHIVNTLVEGLPGEAQVTVGVNYIFFVGSFSSPVFEPVTQGSVGKLHR